MTSKAISSRLVRAFCCATIVLSICGCSATALRQRPTVFGQEAWEREVRRQGIDPETIEYPLAYSAEMEETASGVAGVAATAEKLRRLQAYLFDRKLFDFDYEARSTYTALQAFEKRSGNCVSFTALFIALARSQRIPIRAALLTYPGSTEQEGDLLVVRNHMVAIFGRSDEMRVYDFSRLARQQHPATDLLDDIGVTAIYLNNIGSAELFAGNEASALHYFETAAKLAPEYTPTYANMGVVRRRLGDEEGALAAYHQALRIDVRQPVVLNNLAALYYTQGRVVEAQAAIRAAALREATPNLLIVRGNIELVEGNHSQALRHFKRAARLNPDAAEPHVAIARAQLTRGRTSAARRALLRALEKDPENETARTLLENGSL